MIVLISVLAYFDVHISARVLGVALIGEIVILLIFDAVVFGHGGSNIQAAAINPINAFKGLRAGKDHGDSDRRRCRRDRHLLRLLVVGRLRDGPELRRGVEEPEEDRAAGHVHLGDRPRDLLHDHLVGGDLRLRQHGTPRPSSAQNNSAEFFFVPAKQFGNDVPQGSCSATSSSPARSLAAWRSTTPRPATCTRSVVSACCRAALGRTHAKHHSPHIASITQSVIAAVDRARVRGSREHRRPTAAGVLGRLPPGVRPDGGHGRRLDPRRPGARLGRDHDLLPHAPRGRRTTGGRPSPLR